MVRIGCLVVCALGMLGAQASEGIFWEASAPGRPLLLLMPTVHVLPDPAEDIDAVLAQALTRVNSVVIESPVSGVSKAEKAAILQQEMYPLTDSLENYVGLENLDALHACADKAQLPYNVFTRFKPWAMTLLVMHRVKTPPAYVGFEERITQAALATHRNFSTLITAEENGKYLGAVPERLQIVGLLQACKRFDRPVDNDLIRDIAKDWRQADINELAVDIERPMEPGDVPQLKQASDLMYALGTSLFMSALMSDRIQSMKGPILVAVGAAHLIGASSMLPLLEHEGYRVQRVNLEKLPVIPDSVSVGSTGDAY